MQRYITQSLELHLFFARIMKEHALFLEAGFTPKNAPWAKRAEELKNDFEKLLSQVVDISCGQIRPMVLNSGEFVTNHTLESERKTQNFTGIVINSNITTREENLISGMCRQTRIELTQLIKQLNTQALRQVNEIIEFKEALLREVLACKMFTTNYPLLIEHILREAKLYRSLIMALENNQDIDSGNMKETELFWDQIMMEHALFIRGLLDPSEEVLVNTANNFAIDYKNLIEETKRASDMMLNSITNKAMEETTKYRNFKEAGTVGINDCKIKSIIVPLLADHVLREANHYLRILNSK